MKPYTVTRKFHEAERAVIEAAKALVLSEGDSDTKFCSYFELLALQKAVATLREQEGE